MSKKRKLEKFLVDESSEEDEDYVEGESIDSECDDLQDEIAMEKLKTTNPQAYANLKRVKSQLFKTEPNIITILEEPLLLHDRAKLVQMYEIYKNYTPNTDEWLRARTQLIQSYNSFKSGYEQYKKFTDVERKKFDQEILNIKNCDFQTSLQYKILSLNTTTENRAAIYRKYENFLSMSTDDTDYSKLKTWLDYAVNLPYDNMKQIPYEKQGLTKFLQNVAKKLDKELYGMEKVKEQILIFLSSKILNPSIKKCNLGLVGAPGTGKTRIAMLLASIMDYPFEKISFGGVTSASYLTGHEPAWVGAKPGEIVKCLRRMGYKNGLLLLDEFEKAHPEVHAACLHITDADQQSKFTDAYMSSDIVFDLSNMFFVYSVNSIPTDEAMTDRIFFIEVPGYSADDKVKIIERHLVPKTLENIGINPKSIKIDGSTSRYLINEVCDKDDKGVRTLEKVILSMFNKINFLVQHQDKNGKLPGFNISFNTKRKLSYPVTVTKEMIDTFL